MHKDFIGAPQNRSDSDNGAYVQVVVEAVHSPDAFAHFKRHPAYTCILEHVSESQGADYLAIIREQTPEMMDSIDAVRANDEVGNPRVFDYGDIGRFSPTTLRYLKVVSDLHSMFGSLRDFRIAEVGIGYGGQLLVVDRVVHTRAYHMFDLLPVLELASKCLERQILNTAYHPQLLNCFEGNIEFDLVISNYAFSELPIELQMQYIDKVFRHAKRRLPNDEPGCRNSTQNVGKSVAPAPAGI